MLMYYQEKGRKININEGGAVGVAIPPKLIAGA